MEYEVSHIVGANERHKISQAGSAMKSHESSAWRDVFSDPAVRPLLVCCVALHVAQQMCGINAVFYYSTMFFEGVIDNPLLGTTLVAAVNVAATYLAIILMDQCGRRALLLWSAGGMFLCTLLLTAALQGVVPKMGALAAVYPAGRRARAHTQDFLEYAFLRFGPGKERRKKKTPETVFFFEVKT